MDYAISKHTSTAISLRKSEIIPLDVNVGDINKSSHITAEKGIKVSEKSNSSLSPS